MFKRSAIPVIWALLIVIAEPAQADIEGKTTVKCYNQNTPVDCRMTTREGGLLAGSGLEGTFLEALIDAAQLLDRVYKAVSAIIAQNYPGAAYQLYESYKEALQLGQSGADKQALEKVWLKLDQGASYTRVTLTFEVKSNDDPFLPMRVAIPPVTYTLADQGIADDGGRISRPASNLPPMRAIVVDESLLDASGTKGKVTVSLYPKRIPQGSWYPIVLSAKEDNCGICLGIVHVINVSSYKECRLTPNSSCDRYAKEFEDAIVQINEAYGSAYPLMKELIRNDVARQRYCGADGQVIPPGGRPRPRGCDDPGEERFNPGACPQYAAGLSRESCNAVRPYFENVIRPLQAKQEELAQRILQEDCCNPYVNPTGGTGKKGIDLNVTAPQEHGHPRDAQHEGAAAHPAQQPQHKGEAAHPVEQP